MNGVLSAIRGPNLSDALVIAIAAALPWSTSIATILIVLWFISRLIVLDIGELARAVLSPYAVFGIGLVLLAVIGMFYADISWAERIKGFGPFYRLLAIPFLLVQFQRSDRALWAAAAFVLSCSVLLCLSLYLLLWPGLSFRGHQNPGVYFKDYMTQSALFMLCAFGLIGYAIQEWGRNNATRAGGAAVLGLLFLADVAYVMTTGSIPAFIPAVVVFIVLSLVLATREFGARGLPIGVIGLAVLAGLLWFTVPPLKNQAIRAVDEIQQYRLDGVINYPGRRFETVKEAARLAAQAPLLGHGTGTVPHLFVGFKFVQGLTNPHQQVLNVMIQLGLIGAALLIAMWIAHLTLFSSLGLAAWIGLIVVIQNIIVSLSSSFLFDYTSGWTYVMAAGVMGGAVLRERSQAKGKLEWTKQA